MEAIAPKEYFDTRKKRTLLTNIKNAQGISHLIQKCRDKESRTFDMCATYLRKNAMYIDHANSHGRTSRLMHVQEELPSSMPQYSPQTSQTLSTIEETPYAPQEKTLDEVSYLFHSMAQQHGVTPAYRMFSNKPFRESLSIPDRIWNELEPQIKDKIIVIRASIRKKNEVSKSRQAIPSQYPTMTKDTMLNLVSTMADFVIEDDDEDTDDDFLHGTSAMMVRVSHDAPFDEVPEGNPEEDIEVRVHFEYTRHSELKTKFYALSDKGNLV